MTNPDKIAYVDVLCVDGAVAVVSIARRTVGSVVTTQLVRGHSLTPQAIADALTGCSAAVTMEPDESNLTPLLALCPNLVVVRLDPMHTGLIANPFVGVLLGSRLFPTKGANGLWQMYAQRGVHAALDELLKNARSRLDMLIDVAAILNRHAQPQLSAR